MLVVDLGSRSRSAFVPVGQSGCYEIGYELNRFWYCGPKWLFLPVSKKQVKFL